MDTTLRQCLDDLQRRLDDRQESANRDAWRGFVTEGCREEYFRAPARRSCPPGVHWPEVAVNDAIDDFDCMLLQQFGACSEALAKGWNVRLNVRCNYGTGILPVLFGCELFVMDRDTNTLPTARPLASADKVRALVDAGVPQMRGGLVGKVFAAAERFLDAFARYPEIGRDVFLYHPDAQGPIDLAEMVWGSDIFYAFHDDAELLGDLLELLTETYSVFMRKWFELVPSDGACSAHWGMAHAGKIALRNDSLMNLSPQAYAQFIRPLDQRLLEEFGGIVHFCGRGDHFIEELCSLRGLTGVNLSQPHLNDMERIYRYTVDAGIRILGLPEAVARSAGRPLRGLVAVS